MLIDVKERMEDEAIKELLAYSIFPDPEKLEKTLQEYKSTADMELLALEDDGDIIGIIGFHTLEKIIEIRHIAVDPSSRGLGYGRGLILEVIEKKNPEEIIAETDDEAVDFYRNIGFIINSLGEKHPGVERFKCVFQVNEGL